MMIDKAVYKSVAGSFGRNIEWREDKSMDRVRVYSNKDKIHTFHDGSDPM